MTVRRFFHQWPSVSHDGHSHCPRQTCHIESLQDAVEEAKALVREADHQVGSLLSHLYSCGIHVDEKSNTPLPITTVSRDLFYPDNLPPSSSNDSRMTLTGTCARIIYQSTFNVFRSVKLIFRKQPDASFSTLKSALKYRPSNALATIGACARSYPPYVAVLVLQHVVAMLLQCHLHEV